MYLWIGKPRNQKGESDETWNVRNIDLRSSREVIITELWRTASGNNNRTLVVVVFKSIVPRPHKTLGVIWRFGVAFDLYHQVALSNVVLKPPRIVYHRSLSHHQKLDCWRSQPQWRLPNRRIGWSFWRTEKWLGYRQVYPRFVQV